MASARPQTMERSPQTKLERLIQPPIVTRQKRVSATSPRKAPMRKSQKSLWNPHPAAKTVGFSFYF